MKAMILAAGFGSRLGKLTEELPKCLVEVQGRPMLEHVILRLRKAGVTEIMINLHYLPEQVKDFISSKGYADLKICFSQEDKILGTGGALKNARSFFEKEDAFLVHNADILSDIDLVRLIEAQRKGRQFASLAVIPRQTDSYLVCNREERVVGWINEEKQLSNLIAGEVVEHEVTFTGVHAASGSVFELFKNEEEEEFSFFTPYMKASHAGEVMKAFLSSEDSWIDIGNPVDLAKARQG